MEYLLKKDLTDKEIKLTKSRIRISKYKAFKKIIDLEYKIKYMIKEIKNERNKIEFKNEIFLKIQYMYSTFKISLNLYLYLSIIKTLVFEQLNNPKEKNNYYLIKNLITFNTLFKKNQKNDKIKNNMKRKDKLLSKINYSILSK